MNLEDYAQLVKERHCRTCGRKLPAKIEHYDHEGGWKVDGYDERQWLYVNCPNCGYDNALWKLSIPGDRDHLPERQK